MFEWDLNNQEPFQMFVKDTFDKDSVPCKWLSGSLNDYCRMLKLKIKDLDGDKYSVFVKVEKGNQQLLYYYVIIIFYFLRHIHRQTL